VRYGPKDLEAKHSLYTKTTSTYHWSGEDKEDVSKKFFRMCGIELCVTRGRSRVLMEIYAHEKSAAS
jgi:hypothetical protein